MTRKEQTGIRSLDFSQWIRENLKDSFNGLIAQDIDWIFVNYCTGNFIIVEEKTKRSTASCKTNPAQTVIFKMLDEAFTIFSKVNQKHKLSKNPATGKEYIYRGAFIIEFIGGTDPENSSKIFVNGKEIEKERLKELLNLENDELLEEYKSSWIDENLSNQLKNLTGKCK